MTNYIMTKEFIPTTNLPGRSSVAGSIAALVAVGFPAPLVIPVAPPDALGIHPNGLGKAPARAAQEPGHFYYLTDWRHGVSDEIREEADAAGANAGLILGMAWSGQQFAFLDFDMLTGATEEDRATIVAVHLRSRMVRAIERFLGKPVPVRNTRPGRAGVPFHIDPAANPGRKEIIHLDHAQEGDLGKIEVLSNGQQVVMAGVHPVTKAPITWCMSDAEHVLAPVPQLDDIPVLPNRAALNTLVDFILSDLLLAKISAHRGAAASGLSTTLPDAIRAEDQVPPTADSVVRLLDMLTHDHRVDRNYYVTVMLSCVGCIRALQELGRATDGELEELRDAAIRWAASWQDPKGVGTTIEAEAGKWEKDWSRVPDVMSGWHTLLLVGRNIGIEDLHVFAAQEEFEPTEGPAPPRLTAPTGQPIAAQILPVPKEAKPTLPQIEPTPTASDGYLSRDIKASPHAPEPNQADDLATLTSDMTLADVAERTLRGVAVYREDEKRWIVWQGEGDAWSAPGGDRIVRTWIENVIRKHIRRHAQTLRDKHDTLASVARINAVESLLRTRLGYQPPAHQRAVHAFFLQTPTGLYDLRTGEKRTTDDQRNMMEMRRTEVAPADIATPEFDKIVSLMCGHDEEVIEWLWLYLGYLLLGRPVGHNLLVIHGPGGNGKGSFCRTIQRAMGGYAIEALRDLLLESGKKQHKTSLYDLKGKRFWFISEISENEAWNEAQVKSLTGGDRIQANKMHHDMTYFDSEGTFIIATNNLPDFSKIDDAVRRRFFMIRAHLKPDHKDLLIEDRIAESGELSGILFKMMARARKVYENGMVLPETPAAMQTAVAGYFHDQDTLGQWMAECCIVGDGRETSASSALESYNRWLSNHGLKTTNSKELKKVLTMIRGVHHREVSANSRFVGFALSEQDRPAAAYNDNVVAAAA